MSENESGRRILTDKKYVVKEDNSSDAYEKGQYLLVEADTLKIVARFFRRQEAKRFAAFGNLWAKEFGGQGGSDGE